MINAVHSKATVNSKGREKKSQNLSTNADSYVYTRIVQCHMEKFTIVIKSLVGQRIKYEHDFYRRLQLIYRYSLNPVFFNLL